jgi:hypothetical protein
MAVTHVWSVKSNLQTKAQGDYDNVVFRVTCSLYSSETVEDRVYKATTLTEVTLNTNNLTSFTPFADLTEEQVLGWAKAKIDANAAQSDQTPTCAEMEAAHVAFINEQINPPLQNQTAPWADQQIVLVDPNPPEL